MVTAIPIFVRAMRSDGRWHIWVARRGVTACGKRVERFPTISVMRQSKTYREGHRARSECVVCLAKTKKTT